MRLGYGNAYDTTFLKKDPTFDILSKKSELENDVPIDTLDEYDVDFESLPEFSYVEKDGALFIAAKCAHSMRYQQPSLITTENQFTFGDIHHVFADLIKSQSLSFPSADWRKDVEEMLKIFNAMNPPNAIQSKIGIVQGFTDLFKQKFPQYSDKLLNLCAKNCIYVRLRWINQMAASKTKTARGARKTAQLALS